MSNNPEQTTAPSEVIQQQEARRMSKKVLGPPPGVMEDSSGITPARKMVVENVSLIFQYRKPIIYLTLLVTALTSIYCFGFLKNQYTATSIILPARKSGDGLLGSLTSGLSSTMKDLGMMKIGGSSEGSYSPIALMASRELREKVVKQFNLQTVYQADNIEDALKEFDSHTNTFLTEEDNFAVSFEDVDPKRAAAVANALVTAMNDVNSDLAIEEAKKNLTYVQKRYNNTLSQLEADEAKLHEFQKKYGVYALETQAAAELDGVGALMQQRFMTEVQLKSAESIYGTQGPEAVAYRNALAALDNKIGDINAGLDSRASSVMMPLKLLPDVAMEYFRLMREVEIQSKMKAILTPSFEQAKLDQDRKTLAFVTLDRAVPPLKKSGPHRSTILLGTMLSTLALLGAGVMMFGKIQRVRARFAIDQAKLGIRA